MADACPVDIPDRLCVTGILQSDIYYSKFAKDHSMFVMEQSCNGSHPETHWKHETPLPGCDCKLLTVVAAGN